MGVGGVGLAIRSAVSADRWSPERSAHRSAQEEPEEMESEALGAEASLAATARPPLCE
jgi:hypothetical protein